MSDVIVCDRVYKRYGSKAALAGFDLTVPEGMVYGLLGPNGAGKTTAVRMLATLARPDSGRIEVAGFDAVRDAARVRQRIGLVGQYAAVDEALSGRQNLVLFGKLHHLGAARARKRADELLEWFGLADTGDKPIEQYSGGMRRRLDLAAGFLTAPAVLFLDEPTTGLDPQNRNQVWDAVRGLVAAGTTVLLTTQYLEEADQLSARVSVVDHGRVIATGSPHELKSRLGGDRIDVVVRDSADLAATAEMMRTRLHAEPTVDADTRRVGAPAADPVADLTDIANTLRDSGIPVEDLALRRPTLDEVFLHLTDARRDVEAIA
ncbi:ATP-binding cassette domain-containing protein [Nocardia acididurans]|uniref:ATP-binding cassette domain-containing protein n=1 Tax=Nocardia acididurans TaxID=2802282 RepID=UPI0027DE4C72|nr:ATP-binding cassette domain-containing protein [Nocardia acididurans]